VVSAVTISRMNITGFLISVRGLSLTKAEPIAGSTILGSNSAETGTRLRMFEVSMELLRVNSMRTRCQRSSRAARRWDRVRAREKR
jgi:hypothetical protein